MDSLTWIFSHICGQGRCFVIDGSPLPVCQRCLGTLTVALEAPIAVGVVQDIAAEQRLPRRLDPWIVTDEEGDLFDLAEEELLLALPIVALHEDESCHASPVVAGDAGNNRNPFRVLAELKPQR